MRPGWQTSEAWATLLAVLLATLHPMVMGTSWEATVASALAVLAALGYSAARSSVKVAALQAGAEQAKLLVEEMRAPRTGTQQAEPPKL